MIDLSRAYNQDAKHAPERIRTTNLLIRSQMLYPVELRAHLLGKMNIAENVLVALFTVSFYGRPCETVQTEENMGKNATSKSRSP